MRSQGGGCGGRRKGGGGCGIVDEGLAGSCRCGGGCAAIDRLGRDVGSVHGDAHWSEETYWIRAPSFAREHAGVLALCACSDAQGVKGSDQSNDSKDRGGVNGGRVQLLSPARAEHMGRHLPQKV